MMCRRGRCHAGGVTYGIGDVLLSDERRQSHPRPITIPPPLNANPQRQAGGRSRKETAVVSAAMATA